MGTTGFGYPQKLEGKCATSLLLPLLVATLTQAQLCIFVPPIPPSEETLPRQLNRCSAGIAGCMDELTGWIDGLE